MYDMRAQYHVNTAARCKKTQSCIALAGMDNKFALHRAWLLLGWVNHLGTYPTT